MKTFAAIGFVLGSLLLIGCAHNERSGGAAVVSATTSASAPDANGEPKPDENLVQLTAYRAVSELQRYVDTSTSSARDPEQLIEAARQAVIAAAQINPKTENQYLTAQYDKLEDAARLRYATFMVDDLRKFTDSGTLTGRTAQEVITATRRAIAKADQSDAGIVKLKVGLPELERQARLGYAEKTIWLLQDFVNGGVTSLPAVKGAEAAVMAALQAGDDAYELHAKFVKLKARACAMNKLACE